MTDGELADALREAEEESQRDREAARKSIAKRDKLVRMALRKKWTHAKIAEVTGLTRGRINQLR